MRMTVAWSVFLLAIFSVPGCGADQTARKMELARFALAYHEHNAAHGASPVYLDDLKGQSSTFPNVYKQIQDGHIVVIWRARLSQKFDENDESVLAYEKTVPEKGGWVVLGGGLVRQLSADEFQRLPKIKHAAE